MGTSDLTSGRSTEQPSAAAVSDERRRIFNPTTSAAGGASGDELAATIPASTTTKTTLPPKISTSMKSMKESGAVSGKKGRTNKGGGGGEAKEKSLLNLVLLESRDEVFPKKNDALKWASKTRDGEVLHNVRLTTADDLWKNSLSKKPLFAANCNNGQYFFYAWDGTKNIEATSFSSVNFPNAGEIEAMYTMKWLFVSPDVYPGEHGAPNVKKRKQQDDDDDEEEEDDDDDDDDEDDDDNDDAQGDMAGTGTKAVVGKSSSRSSRTSSSAAANVGGDTGTGAGGGGETDGDTGSGVTDGGETDGAGVTGGGGDATAAGGGGGDAAHVHVVDDMNVMGLPLDYDNNLQFRPDAPFPLPTPAQLRLARIHFVTSERVRRPVLAKYSFEDMCLPSWHFNDMPFHLPDGGCEHGCRCVTCGLRLLAGDHGVCDRCGHHLCLISRDWGDEHHTHCGDTVDGNIQLPGLDDFVPFVRMCHPCMQLDPTTQDDVNE